MINTLAVLVGKDVEALGRVGDDGAQPVVHGHAAVAYLSHVRMHACLCNPGREVPR